MNEVELAEHCRKKDRYAQNQLYKCYADSLYTICIRYTGDKEIAKDLLHDGFFKIFTSFERFNYRGEGSLKAWMSRVMVNTALEYLRKNEKELFTGLDEVSELTDTSDENNQLEKVPQKVLMQFLADLPPGYRTVFNLYVFEEKSHKEIAALLGINEKSSSSQLYRAKTLLIRRVNEYIHENK